MKHQFHALLKVAFALLVATSVSAQTKEPSGQNPATADLPINYTLANSGRVSLNIYDPLGYSVRQLKWAEQQTAGAHTVTWDGKDGNGAVARDAAQCTWKLLETQGLCAKYLMNVGTSLPDGNERNERRNFGLGNQGPASALAVENDHIYVISGGHENVRGALKMNLNGKLFWGSDNARGWAGWSDVAYLDGLCYYLISGEPGDDDGALAKLSANAGYGGGSNIPGWNILWPGDPSGHCGRHMDLCAYNSGNHPQLLLSYEKHNVVRWISTTDGSVSAEATIASPLGLAIENNGSVLAISANKVVRFSKSNKTAVDVISTGLAAPRRMTVDRTNGDILVADLGTSQQIKRFSSAGQLKATYGKAGGRDNGLYDPKHFQGVTDIASDGHGGFIVTEESAPRRIARFDADGSLIKEWYASTTGIASWFNVDSDDPNVVWYDTGDMNNPEMVRAIVDFKNRTWRVHSTYKINGLASGLIEVRYSPNKHYPYILEMKKRNGTRYFTTKMENTGWVLRLDETNWKLMPVSVIQPSLQWTDANSDGLAQETEYKRYDGSKYQDGNAKSFFTGPDFSWYLSTTVYQQTSDVMKKIPLLEWRNGAPVYADPVDVVTFGTYPEDIVNRKQDAAFCDGGYLYEALNICGIHGETAPPSGWGETGPARLLKRDMTGKLVWYASPPKSLLTVGGRAGSLLPGEVGTFADFGGIDTVNGCMVVPGKDGAYNGSCPGMVYCWDKDGLWVDNLLGNGDLSAVAYYQNKVSMYEMGSEPWFIATRVKDANTVYLYGNWENHVRIWEISGWDKWERQSGNFAGGVTQVAAPAFSLAAGPYLVGQSVSMSTATSGATIRYTTDGTTPTPAIGTVYSGPVTMKVGTEFKAIAFKKGLQTSGVATSSYQLVVGTSVLTNQLPATSDTDGVSYEMGMKFRSTVAGRVAGIRFYKPAAEKGTHTGRLWMGDTLLATADFTDESASGWQTATLATPIILKADTPYVVSVNSNTYYSHTKQGLATAITNGPLSSIADSPWDNGLQGPIGAFPTRTHQNTNYFRDVVFVPGTPGGSVMISKPTFTAKPGTYNAALPVTIRTTTGGVSIRYTTDGSTPSSTAGTLYSSPVSIAATTTLKAIAYRSGAPDSSVTSAIYTIIPSQPAQVPESLPRRPQ